MFSKILHVGAPRGPKSHIGTIINALVILVMHIKFDQNLVRPF